MIKTNLLVLTLLIATAVYSLPYAQQLALVNSLQVGRLEDPNLWTCVGCDETNKPIHSYVIQQPVVEIRSILSVYQEYTVLAFRYTANLKNLWQDILWAFQTQDQHAPKGCKVQRQYDRMWNRIRDIVLSQLRQNVHPHTKRLIITGISLGGGLAEISMVDILASKQFNNIEVITFGAPRVGNKKWAKWFDSITQSTRIYIRRDPIAFLPRCLTPICNYRQVGNPIVCYPKKQICKQKGKSVEDDEQYELQMKEAIPTLIKQLNEHKEQLADGDFEGIIDHIYGYKKIRDYTLVS